MPPVWLLPRPLILASKSQARRALLAAAGIAFEALDARVEEHGVKQRMRKEGAHGAAIAATLARDKGLAVSALRPDRLVVGADQTLSIEGRLLSKAADLAAARAQLMSMAGKQHTLHSALSLVRDGVVIADACAEAHLTCRPFTEAFVDCYLGLAGESVLQSVGCYAVEGLGIHLFSRIEGDQSTILGLPMIPLLHLLREHGAVER